MVSNVSSCTTTLEIPSIARLKCTIQNYEWGKKGIDSLVAQLANNNETIKPELSYAELWMGIHPNGPSEVLLEQDHTIPLSKVVPGMNNLCKYRITFFIQGFFCW